MQFPDLIGGKDRAVVDFDLGIFPYPIALNVLLENAAGGLEKVSPAEQAAQFWDVNNILIAAVKPGYVHK